MAEYVWPRQGTTTLIGKEIVKEDSAPKATGTAKYAYDIVRPNMVFAKLLTCPHAHARLTALNTAPALQVRGVVAAQAMANVGKECQYVGDLIAVVAAESEAAAAEGARAIQATYEVLPVFTNDADLAAARAAGRAGTTARNVVLVNEEIEDEAGENAEIERLYQASPVKVEGDYGIHVITHCCLETHGSTCEWTGDQLTAHLSTQNVSGTAGQFAGPLDTSADKVTVHCDYIGGGFGSKFAADVWGVACARLARELGRPVKLMLDRDVEQMIAGNRPSGFAHVRVGADNQGVVQVWDSQHWGTGGATGGTVNVQTVPYVFAPRNLRRTATGITTNIGPQRAWRAPNHPQACAMSQTAYDDVAAQLGISSYDVFLRNLANVSNGKGEVYRAQMEIAKRLIDWDAKWHAHGRGPRQGSVVTGLGIGIHTWGGGGHSSTCRLTIHPDGGVEVSLGSQDLGTGTRTVIGMVIAETLGLPLAAVRVNIGSSRYPASGPSGGSTTVGGVSESTRRAALDAMDRIYALVAPRLETQPGNLEAVGGRIRVRGQADKSLSWREACQLIGMQPLEVTGNFERGRTETRLSSSQVAGVQMAEVAVDLETGVVKMKKFVAIQDMGLIINRMSASSQIYGALIMGIAYALFEEQRMDHTTGQFVNAGLADYSLPRLGDIGELVVHLYEPASEYDRGVIGLGEPPVIAPGAAISNAVANATGVRVPVLPLTPRRVLDALARPRQAGGRS